MGDVNAPEGIDVEGVTRWFSEHVDGVAPPLSFELIAGGHSNLTFRVTDATGRAFVLRRPPLGQVLRSAHDMGREHRIISALADTDVPVAPALGLCVDESVNGAPFYVMSFVDGLIVRSSPDAAHLNPSQRGRACGSLVEVLAAIHSVDVDGVGLGNLGKREDYIGRQLKRWVTQFRQSSEQLPGGRFPDLIGLHDRLAARVPPQRRTAIVHGDYRLDNCILGPDGGVVAVLDWEICTLGDPLADLGLLSVYWADPGDPAVLPQGNYLAEDGFWRRADLFARYSEITGVNVDDIGYYVAFGYWKLGCIIAGVYARYAGGSMGSAVTEQTVNQFADMLQAIYNTGVSAIETI